jgi:hypothetical protein
VNSTIDAAGPSKPVAAFIEANDREPTPPHYTAKARDSHENDRSQRT